MITDRIRRHQVLLPINYTMTKIKTTYNNEKFKFLEKRRASVNFDFEVRQKWNPFKYKCPIAGCVNEAYCPTTC